MSRFSVGESLLLVLQGKRILINIPYIKVMPGDFLSFEAFVLFAQAPDVGN